MIGTSQLINAFSRPCFTDTTDIFKDGSGVALYGLDYDASDTGGASGKFGEAAIFNGSSSKIVTTLNPNGFSQIAISCWIKTTSTGANNHIVSANDGTNWCFLSMASGIVTFGASNGGSSIFSATHTGAINDGNWHHVVGNYNGTNATLYIDSTGYTPVSATASLSVNTAFGIGYRNTASPSGTYYDGSIDQVRIFNTALTSSQVIQLHQENSSTVGTHLFGCIANYNFDGSAKESMGTTAYDGTETDITYRYDGTPTAVDFGVGGKINYGARFNGSSSKIVTGIDLTSFSSTSLSVWVYWTGGDFSPIFGGNNTISGTTTINRFNTSISSSGGRLDYISKQGDYFRTTDMSLFSSNAWNHIVITDDFTTNNTSSKLYVNGVLENSFAVVANSYGGATNTNLYIGQGRTNNNIQAYATGSLDQVRIFSKALSSAEVGKLYGNGAGEIPCVYTSTTDQANYPIAERAYFKFDNSTQDEKDAHSGTSETDIEYRFGRFGQAVVFNGTSSQIDTTATLIPSNTDFSISFWINPNNQIAAIISRGLVTTSGNGYGFNISYNNSNQNFNFFRHTGNAYTGEHYASSSNNSVPLNTWTHVVWTFDKSAGEPKFYANGEEQSVTIVTYAGGTGSSMATGNIAFFGAYDGGKYRLGNRNNNLSTSRFSGKLDQLKVFDSVLTSDNVTELYNEKPEVDTSNFKTVLYEGTGATQYISNVGMDLETSGGLVWIKNRDTSEKWHSLADSVRGGGKRIFSNETSVQLTDTYDTQSFEANGFIIGNGDYVSRNNESHVAWVWKGGGEAVQNTQGTITSDVSANVDAGFSIATYTGVGYPNSATAEVGHGLLQAPDIVFIKGTGGTGQSGGAGSWVMGTGVLPTNNWVGGMYLNSNGAYYTAINYFWNGAATDSVVKLKTDWFVNGVNNTYVMYSWHSIPGYSKIGSYTGNGSSTGPIVYTTDDGTSSGSNGFEPRWVMIRRTDDTGNWYIVDSIRSTANPRNDRLLANTDNSEVSYTPGNIDFLSNGFQLKGTYNSTNALNGTYIYMAFK